MVAAKPAFFASEKAGMGSRTFVEKLPSRKQMGRDDGDGDEDGRRCYGREVGLVF